MHIPDAFAATLSGLGALFEIDLGSREEAATHGWMMECLQHSLSVVAKVANRFQRGEGEFGIALERVPPKGVVASWNR
jgi:hypothetical protein